MKKSRWFNFLYLILFLWIVGFPINTLASSTSEYLDTSEFYEWVKEVTPISKQLCVYGDSNSKVPKVKLIQQMMNKKKTHN
ncbi:MAG: hypothetical protein IKN63_05765 [Bacilli bacterium]|nr:hypothetical protein [Bacilli bacterium]